MTHSIETLTHNNVWLLNTWKMAVQRWW